MAAQPCHVVLGRRCCGSGDPREPCQAVLGSTLVRHHDLALLLDELPDLRKVVAQFTDGRRSHGVRQLCLTEPGDINSLAGDDRNDKGPFTHASPVYGTSSRPWINGCSIRCTNPFHTVPERCTCSRFGKRSLSHSSRACTAARGAPGSTGLPRARQDNRTISSNAAYARTVCGTGGRGVGRHAPRRLRSGGPYHETVRCSCLPSHRL